MCVYILVLAIIIILIILAIITVSLHRLQARIAGIIG